MKGGKLPCPCVESPCCGCKLPDSTSAEGRQPSGGDEAGCCGSLVADADAAAFDKRRCLLVLVFSFCSHGDEPEWNAGAEGGELP